MTKSVTCQAHKRLRLFLRVSSALHRTTCGLWRECAVFGGKATELGLLHKVQPPGTKGVTCDFLQASLRVLLWEMARLVIEEYISSHNEHEHS